MAVEVELSREESGLLVDCEEVLLGDVLVELLTVDVTVLDDGASVVAPWVLADELGEALVVVAEEVLLAVAVVNVADVSPSVLPTVVVDDVSSVVITFAPVDVELPVEVSGVLVDCVELLPVVVLVAVTDVDASELLTKMLVVDDASWLDIAETVVVVNVVVPVELSTDDVAVDVLTVLVIASDVNASVLPNNAVELEVVLALVAVEVELVDVLLIVLEDELVSTVVCSEVGVLDVVVALDSTLDPIHSVK